MEFSSKDAYLWSVLPLTGLASSTGPYGKFTDLPTRPSKSVVLYGIPYDGSYEGNTSLRVMNFTASNLSGPVLNEGPLLYIFSNTCLLKVEWQIIGLKCSDIAPLVGFYTSNWLKTNSSESNYYLFPSETGPSLFQAKSGCFIATGLDCLSVIVEGNYAVVMKITYRNPKCLIIPEPLLYIPTPCAIWHHETIMTHELFPGYPSNLLIKPTPKYFTETATKIAYLEAFSVNLIFSSTNPLTLESLSAINLPSKTYSNIKTLRWPSALNTNSFLSADPDLVVLDVLRSADGVIAFRSKTFPGVNVTTTANIDFDITFTVLSSLLPGQTITIQPSDYMYGRMSTFGYITPYEIRGRVCGFSLPAIEFVAGNVGSTQKYSYSQTTQISSNVRSLSFEGRIKKAKVGGKNLRIDEVGIEVFIKTLRLDFVMTD